MIRCIFLFLLPLFIVTVYSQDGIKDFGGNINVSALSGKKPEHVKNASFDSTFIFETDTITLPFFDEFSTNKFQIFQGNYTAPGVTQQTFYRILEIGRAHV